MQVRIRARGASRIRVRARTVGGLSRPEPAPGTGPEGGRSRRERPARPGGSPKGTGTGGAVHVAGADTEDEPRPSCHQPESRVQRRSGPPRLPRAGRGAGRDRSAPAAGCARSTLGVCSAGAIPGPTARTHGPMARCRMPGGRHVASPPLDDRLDSRPARARLRGRERGLRRPRSGNAGHRHRRLHVPDCGSRLGRGGRARPRDSGCGGHGRARPEGLRWQGSARP